MVYPCEDFSSDEEVPDSDVQPLLVASLEINGISDKQTTCEIEKWASVPCIVNSTLVRMELCLTLLSSSK